MRTSSLLGTAQNKARLMIAVGIMPASAWHALGQDLNGNLGTDFFTTPDIYVTRNALSSTAFSRTTMH